ncbi:glycogen synthase GlgA [Lacisediminimonas profundi]|uniref:glycogen synthase GlgA n=1 Tax=Lacisediminimonas profundi TaxID=2603856 RepID=UPI00124B0786|nr:glycogen synthase GlgA [Lacisediminimonas profundi]
MRVLHACSEVFPLLKTGGLADVTGALPPALARAGCDVRLVLPGFPAMLAGIGPTREIATLSHRFGAARVRLLLGQLPSGVSAYVIDAPELYARAGNPYNDADNHAYADNHRRFGLLAWIAADLAVGLDPDWQAQVVHGHDWHAGLAPAYLKAWERANGRRAAGSVLTVHNLAYQGLFDAHVLPELELPGDYFQMHGLEYYGRVSFLKAGLFFADKLTTVSPAYAREIQSPEQGCGLEGLLQSRAADLVGILNGVDYEVWNPALDPLIPVRYDARRLRGKKECRRALQRMAGLREQDEAPIFGVVSRLTEQKGLHLLLGALPDIVARGGQVVLLGTGDHWLEEAFRVAAQRFPESVSVEIGYHEPRSHEIVAGADIITVPSRFEPCGLTQLYGLAYGTLPLVRRVGGLADSVIDCTPATVADRSGTGFVFDEFSEPAFARAVERAFELFRTPLQWQQAQRNAMRARFSWDDAAARMLPLYQEVAKP